LRNENIVGRKILLLMGQKMPGPDSLLYTNGSNERGEHGLLREKLDSWKALAAIRTS
jgi:hypothetical protein